MKRRRGVGSLDTNLVKYLHEGLRGHLGLECELACVEDSGVLDFIVVGETVSHLDTPTALRAMARNHRRQHHLSDSEAQKACS